MHNSPSSQAVSPPDPFLLAADILDPPVDPYADDPVGYVFDEFEFHAWSKQQDIFNSLRDHQRTAVRACHGPGKTATGAHAALWFLKTHRNSRVITTAPTWAQVEGLLWREIRGAIGRAHAHGHATIFPRPTVTKLELGDEWFAIGLSTNQPERFQGQHADHLLLIVDEASGVHEDIYEAAEGFMTAEGAKVLLLGNPTRVGGQFHRAFTDEIERWSQIHISVYDTPAFTGENVPAHVLRSLPTKAWVEDAIDTYGADSPLFEVRVLGNFPTKAANAIISVAQLEAAQLRSVDVPFPAELKDVTVTCDVARYGDDETVIATRHGNQIRIREAYNGQDTVHTRDRVIHWWSVLRQEAGADPNIVIDDSGVGGGVTDMLREGEYRVTAFNAAETAREPDAYPNRRSELWFQMQSRIGDLDLDTDKKLAGELTAPVYRLVLDRRVVESKDDTKKRLKRSPDRADAVLMTLVQSLEVVLPDPQATQPSTGLPELPHMETGDELTGPLQLEEF